jgi:glycosyltransferase involved in cell wall biosynthesis
MWSPEGGATRPATMPNDARHAPGISIVVTSHNEAAPLRRCLEQFFHLWEQAHAEVIVVHAAARTELTSLAQQFPTIAWIAMDPNTPETDLRRIGFERSSKDIVLFLDYRESERCEWLATLCRNWRVWTDAGGRVISAPVCGREESIPYPYLSVVMPVRNGGPRFLLALQALALSDLPRQSWELVIVDDGSTDESAVVAAQYGDRVVRLRHGPRGPGYARNRGFELTLGECVAFVNADVMVGTDMLRNAVTVLRQQPDVGAVFGSCDASPLTRGFLSQYRSLVQHYYHDRDAGDAFTFSSACGIVRSSVLERAGGYDEWHFSRRQLEDLELGQRIRSLGERIILHAGLRATHLRKWTLRRMIATEIFDRAVPWMRLVKWQLTQDRGGNRVTRTAKKVNIAMSWLGIVSALLAWSAHSLSLSLVAIACVAVVLVNNASQLAFFARERGVTFAAVSVPLDVLYYLIAGIGVVFGWIARQAVGEPTPGAVAEAFTEMGIKRWPPVPVRRVARPPIGSEPPTARPSTELPDFPHIPPAPAVHDPTGYEPSDDASRPIQ